MSVLRSLVLASACLLASACQGNTIDLETDSMAPGSTGDPSGQGDETTTGRTSVATTSTTRETVGETGDVTDVDPGEVVSTLLAIDTAIAPGLPFQAIVVVVRGPTGVTLTLQWLSLDVGSTTAPREPIGEPLVFPDLLVDEGGGFSWATGELLIPGQANPITGSDVVIDVVAEVVPEGAPYCGRVSGDVLSPIQASLDGSTLAMTQIDDPSELPVDFPVSCP
ncbi:MAG: hypothetical protein H6712_05555 [Myxococcales bacterium]|nr:hypothetical protein [Myxococcales bacterium]MCB9713300.1 hypothetical protein [Myxococcales bacterium]